MTAAARKRVMQYDVFQEWAKMTLFPEMAACRLFGTKLVNGANERAHWAIRMKRAKSHIRDATYASHAITSSVPGLYDRVKEHGCSVLIVRICRRRFDSDNVTIACKHFRDGIAKYFGRHDGDVSFWSWAHDQVIGEPGTLIAIGVKAPNQPHLVVGVQGVPR